jgi:hypothetical protein
MKFRLAGQYEASFSRRGEKNLEKSWSSNILIYLPELV